MSKVNGLIGDEKPLLLLLLTIAAEPAEPDEDGNEEVFLQPPDGDVGVKLQEALTLLLPLLPECILLLVMLLLLVIRSEITVL